jgi:hypothetical protein
MHNRPLGEASWTWMPKLECHRLCDLYYMLAHNAPLRRMHLTCLTCYRRVLHYKRRGWTGLERKMELIVQADSVDPKGILLPRKYETYWLAVRSDGFAPNLRKATCKTLMALTYMLGKIKMKLPDGWRQLKRKKKYVVIADCVNPSGIILPRNYSAYWLIFGAVQPALLHPVWFLQKYMLTVAEFVAQI